MKDGSIARLRPRRLGSALVAWNIGVICYPVPVGLMAARSSMGEMRERSR
ncbi:hypothetical protein [Microvirga lenta]|nr:hypothetical protein [Microvirga lenta]MCB5174870.1 hypothetical protein [Microvirga lenta]